MSGRLTQKLYLLEPQYRERVWGGRRLMAHDPPIGEIWCAFEESRIQTGTHAGQTVADLTAEDGEAFLGKDVSSRFGSRFPLLVKLLDCADWLSVQVHPNDEQAERLVGSGNFGKTEAWHFLEVEPGARILAGIKPGTTPATLAAAIRAGTVLEVAQSLHVHAGETYLIPAGTLHALGPGVVLYEVQQSSDVTFRAYDWGRPASIGRQLHIEESVAVIDPYKTAVQASPSALQGTSAVVAVVCPFFALDVLRIADSCFTGDTEARCFHVLTVTEGMVRITCGAETAQLGSHQTAVLAGFAGAYELVAVGSRAVALRATVPRAGIQE
jgi:mannose-6-phosphate isomerase